jgi:single-strand DNA-binding protein
MSGTSLNRVQIIGNLGADPEIRTLPGGAIVANLSVATSDSWTNKETGEKQEKTQWHRVVIFNEPLITNVVEKFMHKGSRVFLEGQLETRKWQDREGTDRYSTEIVLRPFRGELTLLDAPKTSESPATLNSSSAGKAARPQPA